MLKLNFVFFYITQIASRITGTEVKNRHDTARSIGTGVYCLSNVYNLCSPCLHVAHDEGSCGKTVKKYASDAFESTGSVEQVPQV